MEAVTNLLTQIAGQSSPAASPSPPPPPTSLSGSANSEKAPAPKSLGMGSTEGSSSGPSEMLSVPESQPETPDSSDDFIREFLEPQEEPAVDPMQERIALLSEQVAAEVERRDLKRWFRSLVSSIGRAFGQTGWDGELQAEWDSRFQAMMQDPILRENICRKVLRMEIGHGAGPNKVAELIAATAGFVAFGLCGLGD